MPTTHSATSDATSKGRQSISSEVEPDRLEFERQFDQPLMLAGYAELAAGLIMLMAWFLLFAGGILIGTQQYIQSIANELRFVEKIQFSMAILLFWTITNVGILACLAAGLGAFGRRMRFTSKVIDYDREAMPGLPTERGANEFVFTTHPQLCEASAFTRFSSPDFYCWLRIHCYCPPRGSMSAWPPSFP